MRPANRWLKQHIFHYHIHCLYAVTVATMTCFLFEFETYWYFFDTHYWNVFFFLSVLLLLCCHWCNMACDCLLSFTVKMKKFLSSSAKDTVTYFDQGQGSLFISFNVSLLYLIYLFINGLFNDDSSLDYIVPDSRIISEWWTGKDVVMASF
jgi:hypothetical protein